MQGHAGCGMNKYIRAAGRSHYSVSFISVLILVAVSVMVYRSIVDLEKSNASVHKSMRTLLEIDGVESSIKDAEASQRGFLLTGKETYAEPYEPAKQRTLDRLARAGKTLPDWSGSREDLALVENLARRKFEEMDRTIELRREKGRAAAMAVVSTDVGKEFMDQIRDHLVAFQNKQLQLIAQREQAAQSAQHRTILFAALGLLLAVGIFGASLAFGTLDNRKRRLAEQALQRFRAAMDVSADLMFIVDRKSMLLVDVNETARKRLGYSREEILHFGPRELFTGASAGDISEEFDRVIAAIPQTFMERGFLRARDGHQLLVEVNRQGVIIAGQCYIVGIARDISERKKHEEDLAGSRSQLETALNDMQQLNREVSLQSSLNAELQACKTVEETFKAISKHGRQLFPHLAGALYLRNQSRILFEKAVTWGDVTPGEVAFEPEHCWALRRGKPYGVMHFAADTVCRHVAMTSGADRPYLCVPLIAQGETIGLLHLELEAAQADLDEKSHEGLLKATLATSVAEQLSMAIANLRLRETLQFQAIRDPLTGLYNRRFMEETFRREMSRAIRTSGSLAVIAADADNFKRFNDAYGHEAGNSVLRELATLMRAKLRDNDIVCRLGGEEFCIIMPDAGIEIATRRTELLRVNISSTEMTHAGQSLGQCTMSFGIAALPEHGDKWTVLMQLADEALYEAKRSGRNQVRVAKIPKTDLAATGG
jgi:diguanylate cyclase (GGDEF)-like protein/PAS domain S-box-containing protein